MDIRIDDLSPALSFMTLPGKSRYLLSVKKMLSTVQSYATSLPVCSYNGSSYDINLVKSELFKQLQLGSNNKNFVIKKNNKYSLLATEKFRFMDIINFVSQGVSLDQFLKSYECDLEKGYFPYSWFDSIDKLEHKSLPEYSDFYSDLKKCNVLDGEGGEEGGRKCHKELVELWNTKGFQTFRDYLIYYNNLDVIPLTDAIDKMIAVYLKKGIDLLKQSVSVSGIARISLFRSPQVNEKFGLFSQYESDVHTIFKENIVGGPSVVFSRYHENGKTNIRGDPEKTCHAIEGYDANSLYLWSLDQRQPTGLPIIRRKCNNFKPSRRHHSEVATE